MKKSIRGNSAVASTVLNLLFDIILNNTCLDYEGKLTIADGKPILEFIKALDAESYEAVENVKRGKHE